jgi:hypothetical protein
MLPSRILSSTNAGFANVAGRSLLACVMALALLPGVAKVARGNRDCPPACVTCNANPKCGWYNNYCFCTIDPIMSTLGDIDVEDPILT